MRFTTDDVAAEQPPFAPLSLSNIRTVETKVAQLIGSHSLSAIEKTKLPKAFQMQSLMGEHFFILNALLIRGHAACMSLDTIWIWENHISD